MGVAAYFEKSTDASVDQKGNRTYIRKFLVGMANLSDQPPSVWGSGFASIVRYQSYPFDAGALAVTLDASPEGDTGLWYTVRITYKSNPFDLGNTTGNPSDSDASVTPTSRPWTITFGSTHGQRLLTQDTITDAPIASSAGQPYDPPPEIPSSNLTIQITAFESFATFKPIGKVLNYQDYVNEFDILLAVSPAETNTFPAETLRCTEYKSVSHSEQGETYWQVDVTLEFKFNGWNPIELLDCGTLYIKSMTLPIQPVLDQQGNPVSTPVPLNGSGGLLNAGDAPVYLQFNGYNKVDFSTLLS